MRVGSAEFKERDAAQIRMGSSPGSEKRIVQPSCFRNWHSINQRCNRAGETTFDSNATVKRLYFCGWAVMALLLLVLMIFGFLKEEHWVERVAHEKGISAWNYTDAKPKR